MSANEDTRRAITAALAEYRRSRPTTRRHPCEVTADRLGDHLDRYPDAFDGAARDEIGHIRHLLQAIADGTEA